MTLWTIEPRTPLIVRDGRPFGLNPGARAESLDFPFPSTIAGAARAQHWQQLGNSFDKESFGTAEASQVNQVAIKGPLLIEVDQSNRYEWLLPAPGDALVFNMENKHDKNHVRIRRLLPKPIDPTTQNDLAITDTLQMFNPMKDKPTKPPPRYWRWESYRKWLISPQDYETFELHQLGHSGPVRENRVHVAIQRELQTGEDGKLFQTGGLEFQHTVRIDITQPNDELVRERFEIRRLLLAIETDAALHDGLGTLGGEQRLVRWQKQSELNLPTCPEEVRDSILARKCCRMLLLTPAWFRNGYYPEDILSEIDTLGIKIIASGVQRPQTVSGWDYRDADREKDGKAKHSRTKDGRAKPTRRLAAAGSVYFLEFTGDVNIIQEWINHVWMKCISDHNGQPGDDTRHSDQDRRDGFGLAVLGVWDKAQKEAMR